MSPAEILIEAKNEGKSTALHMAAGNGHLGTSRSAIPWRRRREPACSTDPYPGGVKLVFAKLFSRGTSSLTPSQRPRGGFCDASTTDRGRKNRPLSTKRTSTATRRCTGLPSAATSTPPNSSWNMPRHQPWPTRATTCHWIWPTSTTSVKSPSTSWPLPACSRMTTRTPVVWLVQLNPSSSPAKTRTTPDQRQHGATRNS